MRKKSVISNPTPEDIEIGNYITFVPSCATFAGQPQAKGRALDGLSPVVGEIVQVHQTHGWYRVKYRLPGVSYAQHETFRIPVRAEPMQEEHREAKFNYPKKTK